MSITEREAFLAMSTFLREFYSRSDRSIAELIVDIGLESDGSTFDHAAWFDWTRCVQMVRRSGGVEITEAMREEFAANINVGKGAIHLVPETFPVGLDARGYGPRRGDLGRKDWPAYLKWDFWEGDTETDIVRAASRDLATSRSASSLAELGDVLSDIVGRFKSGIVLDVVGTFKIFDIGRDLFERLVRLLSKLAEGWHISGDRAHVVISGPPRLLAETRRIIDDEVQKAPGMTRVDAISYAP